MKRTASISDDGLYRYDLTREWGDSGLVVFCGLNPSTATAEVDDPTIRRCIRFAQRWGHGMLVMLNLFALRSTDPRALHHGRPQGPETIWRGQRWLDEAATYDGIVVAAWGAHKLATGPNWITDYCYNHDIPLMCLGTTKSGAPCHPLYRPADTPLVEYKP